MTFSQAVRFLTGLPRLIFGDPQQIEAVHCIEIVEEARTKVDPSDFPCPDCKGIGRVKCGKCDGDGECYHGNICRYCDGDGKLDCEYCNGDGDGKGWDDMTYADALTLLHSANAEKPQPTK